MLNRVLLVDTRPEVVRRLKELLIGAAVVDVALDFHTARILLFSKPSPKLLVTGLRLGPHNGLHLVHLSKLTDSPPRAIVFGDQVDPYLVRETRALGAFFETTFQMPVMVRAYMASQLPDEDRRDPVITDRRQTFRGGRRAGDLPMQPREWPPMRKVLTARDHL